MARPRKKIVKYSAQDEALERRRYLLWSIMIPFCIVLLYGVWHYRTALYYYLSTTFDRSATSEEKEKKKFDARNIFIMDMHKDSYFGIDVSQYQSDIHWDEVRLINDQFIIDYVFVRATMGEKNVDDKFKENWKALANSSMMRGAYHYFRPNENSIKQAENFIRNVRLKPGDLPPVLDIEEHPKHQSMDSLRLGLRRWLNAVEAHFKVKPIIYSGDKYYSTFLEKEFSDYPLWIANYNFWIETPNAHWDFWQFSEKGTVKGIKGYVDLNLYQRSLEDLEALCVPER